MSKEEKKNRNIQPSTIIAGAALVINVLTLALFFDKERAKKRVEDFKDVFRKKDETPKES